MKPRTLVDHAWEQVLGVLPRSGVSWLDQGGDSLLATELASRLTDMFGLHVSIRSVLEHSTPDVLAGHIADLCERPARPTVTRGSPAQCQESVLSFSQERMWFMHAIAPKSAAYNISLALRLRGSLDVTALQSALAVVVERHTVLRSVYAPRAGSVACIMQPYTSAPLKQTSIPAISGPEKSEQWLRDYLTRCVNQPFDLARGPLLRVELINIDENDALLLILVHHINGDQWSFDVLSRELAEAYNSLVSGGTISSTAPSVDYREYAAWHRQWFRREREGTETAYWVKRLRGLEPVTFTPDSTRPIQQSFRGARVRLDFDPALAVALRALGARYGATLAMVLLTVLKILVHRHTNSTDIGIGVPIANRNHHGSESLVGTLLNTLVLRTDVQGDPDFISLLGRVRDACLDAYEHQDMPFELLVQALRLPRDPSRSPLFGVMFNMLNTPLGELKFEGLKWSRFEFDRRAAQFDLTVTIDVDHDWSIVFEYATELYKRSTVERISTQFLGLLHAVVDAPDTRISALRIVSADDQVQLDCWSTGPERAIEHETLPKLLEGCFSRHALRTALSSGTEILTYNEVNCGVELLARALRSRGIVRNCRVGLCLERSVRMVIAQLAVLRAGGAWVPLDPAYPTERLAYVATDANIDLLVTESALVGRIPWPHAATMLVDDLPVSTHRSTVSDWDDTLDAGPGDPAYLIYTSGSTGEPKGVVVPHRAVCNFLVSMAFEPGIGQGDRLLAVTTLSFDIAILELLLPLTVGAEVVLATQTALTDGKRLIALLESHNVTIMQATPTTWRMLIEAGWAGRPGFRALVGGESLTPDLAGALLDRCARVWNMYGPTETTIWSSCWRVDDGARYGRISLGTPITNTYLRLLDVYGQAVPIGVPGELCIGGYGLATGYHQRPALDAERFIPDPLSRDPDVRIYRTGDRARWLDDGHLQHLGRMDFQVKIRGYRIELGEIEWKLAHHPDLAGSVVITREDQPGDVRLVAYCVPWNQMPETAELRAFLREGLPDYMVPQHFVELGAVPILPNGKIDRAGLPAASAHFLQGPNAAPPRTPLELRLWNLWQEVLGTDCFGIEHDFFDLGGHSLLAVRLIGRIREELGIEVALSLFFRHPTIAHFVAALASPDPGIDGALAELQPDGEHVPLLCICGVQLYRPLAEQFAPSRPVFGIYIPEELSRLGPIEDQQPVLMDVRAIASKYCRIIRQHFAKGPYNLLGWSFGGILAFEIAQQLRTEGEQISLLVVIDSDLPGFGRETLGFRVRRRIKQLFTRSIGSHRTLEPTGSPMQSGPQGVSQCDGGCEDAYMTAIRNYAAQPYPGRILFFEATLARQYSSYGWERLASEFQVLELHADHVGILKNPAVEAIASAIEHELGKIE